MEYRWSCEAVHVKGFQQYSWEKTPTSHDWVLFFYFWVDTLPVVKKKKERKKEVMLMKRVMKHYFKLFILYFQRCDKIRQ
jgi:hypothetical protein